MAQEKVWRVGAFVGVFDGVHKQQAEPITELRIGYVSSKATRLSPTGPSKPLRFEQRAFRRNDGLQGAELPHLLRHFLNSAVTTRFKTHRPPFRVRR